MTLSADYAMSRYAGIAYGVRGPADYASSTSDAVTGGDAVSALAAFSTATSDSAAGGDAVAAIAAFISATADGVTGSDNLAVSNGITFIFSETTTSSDLLNVITGFAIEYAESVTGLDGNIYSLFSPLNILAVEQERRNAFLRTGMRALAANAREPAQVKPENRQSITNTDSRNVPVKSDSRTFET